MHKVLNSFKQDPSQKLHKTVINFQKHQKFSKTQEVSTVKESQWIEIAIEWYRECDKKQLKSLNR